MEGKVYKVGHPHTGHNGIFPWNLELLKHNIDPDSTYYTQDKCHPYFHPFPTRMILKLNE